MKKGNVAIFVPHLGCPHACVFCDQRSISGTKTVPDANEVRRILTQAVADRERTGNDIPCEIAFFGGSFTAVDRDLMVSLLDAAGEFAEHFTGIRISTRPDCIDEPTLALLQKKGVTAIELGVQSMDDRVLMLCGRGHTAEDTIRASNLIRSFGFELGHQMMTGLPGDTPEGTIETARKICALSPDTVRIYPTLVLKGTALADLYLDGRYRPQTVDEAATLCSELIALFEANGVRVIRVGLHADINSSLIVAGPFHPAFGEICESRLYEAEAIKQITQAPHFTGVISVAPGERSKMTGQKREVLDRLSERFGVPCTVREDPALTPRQVAVE